MPARRMAYQINVDPDARLAVVTFAGTVTGAQLLEATRALFARPDWAHPFDAVWDLWRVTEDILGLGDLEALADLKGTRSVGGDAGLDVILVRREMEYVAARLFERLVRPYGQEVRICRAPAEVAGALGRPLPPALGALLA
jgi:hypothetical protein